MQAIRPANSPVALVAIKLWGPIRTTTPKNPIRNPVTRRHVIRSPGTRKWAIGRTISATVAIEIPAKPAVTNCCPQLISMKGIVIRTSDAIPEMKEAFYRCAKCHHSENKYVERGRITEPQVCPSCSAKGQFELIHN